MLVAAPRHRDGVSAGCAPSGVALHRREHQGCRRGAQVFGDEDLLSRIVFHMKGGQTASIGSPMSGVSASMLSIRPNTCAKGIGDGRRDARWSLDPTHFVALPG
jgi:hypothetical protein